ncbi:MAG: methyltransferase [Planctomycetaceae bacterium]
MTEIPMEQKLDQMIIGYWISQAIYAAAKFNIADLLKDGPKSVEQLAEESSANPDALYRLLRALASMGIFAEGESRHFSLTPLAAFLRSDVPGSKHALALMTGDEQFKAWGEIEYSIRTGNVAFDKVFGKPIFDYLGENPDKAKIFDAAMTGIHGREAGGVVESYDFSEFNVVADIGGGNGSQLISILEANPNLRGILFDLPHVIERARPNFEEHGLLNRCELVAGSFFESVPEGADAYIMRHIIHDWDDEKSKTILQNCHRAMSDNAKLLVIESVIPPGNDFFPGKLLDLTMLLIPGGKERTEEEFRDLFGEVGFELSSVTATNAEVSIVEAQKKSSGEHTG